MSVSINTLTVGKRSHRGSLTFVDICDCMVKDISIVKSRKRAEGRVCHLLSIVKIMSPFG